MATFGSCALPRPIAFSSLRNCLLGKGLWKCSTERGRQAPSLFPIMIVSNHGSEFNYKFELTSIYQGHHRHKTTTPSLIPADNIINTMSTRAVQSHTSSTSHEEEQSVKTGRTAPRRSLRRLIISELPYASDWSTPHSWCRSLKHWIHQVYVEVLCMFVVGLLSGLLLRYLPTIFVSKRTFPIWSVDGRLMGPPAISHPLVSSIVPSAVVWVTVTVIPTLVILLFQLRVRCSHDATVGIFGMGKAIVAV